MVGSNKIRTFICCILLLIAGVANAQIDAIQKFDAAFMFYQKNKIDSARANTDASFLKSNLDSAKANIDAAFILPEMASHVEAWLLRGYIYKDIYRFYEKENNHSPARIEALNSLKNALALDTAKESFTEIINGIKTLASSFRNDASKNLDPLEYKTAIKLFSKYIEYYRIVDPSPAAIQALQIEFDLALVAVYNEIMENPKIDIATAEKFFSLAKNVYTKILVVDPNNVLANVGMGKLYYNRAVNIIKALDVGEVDITQIDSFEEDFKKFGKEGKPYMENAHNLDPRREDAILGLAGIYYILNDYEKSKVYQREFEELKGFKIGDRVKWKDLSVTKHGRISGLSNGVEFMVQEDGKEKSVPVKISDLSKTGE